MTDDRDELTAAERAALAALPREITPPADVDSAVLDLLTAKGLVKPSRSPWRTSLAVAAGIILFALGVAVGRNGSPAPATPAGPRFVLLLYEDSPPAASTEAVREQEYAGWAADLRRRGRDISGENLAATGRWLTPPDSVQPVPSSDRGSLGGYFVVQAHDLQEALAIARTCPHLLHGGRILVRPIAAT